MGGFPAGVIQFMETLNGVITCKYENSPPRTRERAANTKLNSLTSPFTLPNSKTIAKKKVTGAVTRRNAGGMRRFWKWWDYVLSLFLGLCFSAWVGLGAVMEDRILPHDFDAEEAVLNAAFYPGGMSKVAHVITADDFYSGTAKLIFSRMMEFHESGRGFTLFSIDQTFLEHPQYLDIRGALDAIRPFTAEDGSYFARMVRELADRRRAIKASYEAFENLFDTSKPIDQVRGFLRVEVPGLLTEVSQ